MKTVLNVKVDTDVKQDAQELAKQLGIPLSVIVNANLREFVAARQVTFSALPRLKPAVEATLTGLEKDIARRRNLSPTFEDGDDLAAYLKQL